MKHSIAWSHEDSVKFYKSKAWEDLKKAFKASLPYGKKGRCSCCGKKSSSLHCDHIIPISVDPSKRLDIHNLQLLCRECNLGKSNKDCCRMSNLTDEARRIKATTYKKSFYTTKWFAPTSSSKKAPSMKTGFFKKKW